MLRRRMFNSGGSGLSIPTTVSATSTKDEDRIPIKENNVVILINDVETYFFTCRYGQSPTQLDLKVNLGDTVKVRIDYIHNCGPTFNLSAQVFTVNEKDGTKNIKFSTKSYDTSSVISDEYAITNNTKSIELTAVRGYNLICP